MVTAMSSGKSAGSHSGAYGAAVMTSLSWFSGKRESSRKCMTGLSLIGLVADDRGALHLPDGWVVVLDGVVLGAAVVPDGEAVRRPAPAHLVVGNRRLADEVVEQVARARGEVDPVPHVLGRVEVDEMGGEPVDEQDLLAGLRVRAHDRVLGVGESFPQGAPLVGRHDRTERRLDAVPREQAADLGLDVLRQPGVRHRHVDPDRVPADRWRLDTPEHAAERRGFLPGPVAMVGVLVVFGRAVEILVDADEPGVIGVAGRDRVVLERAESPRQLNMLGAGDVLIAEE